MPEWSAASWHAKGAFTRALLDARNDPVADTDHVGLINATALAHYVARDVSSLTGGKQNPDMEVRFDTTVFAVGLQCKPRCDPPAPKCGSLIHLFLRPPPVIPG